MTLKSGIHCTLSTEWEKKRQSDSVVKADSVRPSVRGDTAQVLCSPAPPWITPMTLLLNKSAWVFSVWVKGQVTPFYFLSFYRFVFKEGFKWIPVWVHLGIDCTVLYLCQVAVCELFTVGYRSLHCLSNTKVSGCRDRPLCIGNRTHEHLIVRF